MNGPKDITVVGAGPAGLVCAIILGRAGHSVTVREWHADVGHRFHDDFQGLENWTARRDALAELAEAGIAADFDHHAVTEGTLFDTRGRAHRLHGQRPLFYLLRRGSAEGSLDRALLDQARAVGVTCRFNDRVRETSGATVLASGPRRADVIATGQIFETDMQDGAWLALGENLAPRGYSYLLVRNGRGTVASCMFTGFRDHARHFEITLEFFRRHAGLRMRNARAFGGFGNTRLPRTAMQGRHPVIGEQAGFQDALAGFGLRYAMRSGRLAAESMIGGTDYTQAWKQQLEPALRAGIVNRFLFNLFGARGVDQMIGRLRDAEVGGALGRAYGPTLVRRMLFPLARHRFQDVLNDPSCSHQDCDCIWCQHGNHAPPAEARRECNGRVGNATTERDMAELLRPNTKTARK